VSLKSTGHRNTGTGPEEVEEEPMAMLKVQKQQFFFQGNRSNQQIEEDRLTETEPPSQLTEKSRA
jgi:hypothetical protein